MFALLKLILTFFSGEPKFPFIPEVEPSPSNKNYSCDYQQEMMNYYQHQKCVLSLSKLHDPELSNIIP